MKILLVNSIGIDYGGAEVLVRQLKEGLQAQGHDVRVLAGDIPNSPQRFSDYTFRSFKTNSIARFILLIFNPFAVWSLYKILRTFKPDVVHLHIISNASPFILLPLKKIPTVFTIHYHMVFDPTRIEDTPNLKAYENELRYFFINDKRRLRYYGEKLKFFFFRHYYKNIDVVIAYSDFFAQAARDSKLFSKVVVVRNGIQPLPFSPIENKRSLLYLGRMDQVKGVDTLLKAMPEVIKQIPNAILTLAGNGPYINFCEALSKNLGLDNSVDFLGYRNYEDVAELLKESTIVVVPSIWPEAFGLVNVEAMSVGRPVVACRVGGIPEIITDGETGLLINPSDPKALADALIKLLKDPQLIK